MRRKNSLAALVTGTALLCVPAFSQEEIVGKNEANIQMFGSFVTSNTQGGVKQSSRDSGGILLDYRHFFTTHIGVEVDYGISRSTQNYDYGKGPLGTQANQHEVTAEVVYRFRTIRRFTPFVEAGGGALVFDPRHFVGNGTQARATAVYGGGVDYNLTQRLFVRGLYRGLIYNSPTFDLAGTNGVDRVVHRAEPSLGIGFRF
jgi:opacity protein-like surface antigen